MENLDSEFVFKNESPNFKCLLCNYQPSGEIGDTLEAHYDTQHNGNRIKCQLCGDLFRYQFNLPEHELMKHGMLPASNSGVKLYECKVGACGEFKPDPAQGSVIGLNDGTYKTTYRRKIVKHVEVMHRLDTGNFESYLKDGQIVLQTNGSKKDDNIDKKTGDGEKTCDLCPNQYKSPLHVHEHKIRKHGVLPPPGVKVFGCNTEKNGCSFKTTRKYTLYFHCLSRHKLATDVEYKCDQCDKKFQNSHQVRRHLEVEHEGSKMCNFCGELFSTVNGLKAHLEKCVQNPGHKSLDERRKHLCHLCEFKFAEPHHLKRHIDVVHKKLYKQKKYDKNRANWKKPNQKKPKKPKPEAVTPISALGGRKDCPQCGKVFAMVFSLARHIKTAHQEIREYRCKLCDKWFSCAGNLQEHVATKHMGLNVKEYRKNSKEYRQLTVQHEAYEFTPTQFIYQEVEPVNETKDIPTQQYVLLQ